jgi:undecaprenyl-diphosphatase
MEILQAIILGIIEGLTEFLPISSTGHLLIAQELIGYKDTAEVFTVVVQMGALGAVLWYYRDDLTQKVKGLFKRNAQSIAFWKIWILATIPAGLAGIFIESKLSNIATLPVIAAALIIGGIIIWLIETYHKTKPSKTEPQFNKMTTKQALLVGCYQVLALVPGVSRSGATIMGGLLSGLDRVTATAFSFYLSIPILFLAGSYKLIKDREAIASISGGGLALLAGTVAAFITAFIVIGWLLKYVSKHDFKIFAYYRIILGLIILLLVAM